jgi:hypothetical protein
MTFMTFMRQKLQNCFYLKTNSLHVWYGDVNGDKKFTGAFHSAIFIFLSEMGFDEQRFEKEKLVRFHKLFI